MERLMTAVRKHEVLAKAMAMFGRDDELITKVIYKPEI
jgi:hypothetical protein